jgi:hypothetical protein
MKALLRNTEGGKAGTIDGLNLFFGALLGANLGTVDRMPLLSYLELILLLAGTVITLRMLSTSEKRRMMLATVGCYGLLLAGVVFLPKLQPKGLALDDLHRLMVTLAVWTLFVVVTELAPVHKDDPPELQAKAD